MTEALPTEGQRIALVAMPEDPAPLPIGTRGTVRWVNRVDLGAQRFVQVSVDWDNGSRLMLSIPPDSWRPVTYKIKRFYAPSLRNHLTDEVMRTGLTLAEAQAHCQDPATHAEGKWFDGYYEE